MTFNPRIFGADATADGGGLVNQLLVVDDPAVLFSVTFYNNAGAPRYAQIFDLASIPTTWSTPPKLQLRIENDADRSVDYWTGRRFVNGIAIVISTVNNGITLAGSECLIDANYRRKP